MRVGPPGADAPAGAAVFELERFEWTAPDRLEVEGRWSQLRARRFVRPTLTLRGEAGSYRLLALLEHKPWAPDDGERWLAAFAWDGEVPDFHSADLAVASGIEVELPPPVQRGERPKPLEKRPIARAVAREGAERPPVDRVERERAHALQMMRERDAALAARAEAERERDDALAERDAAVAERHAALVERDAARAERDGLAAELRAARTARDVALRDLDAVAAERDAVMRERDAAIRERDAANRERAHPAIRPLSPLRPAEIRMSWVAFWTPRFVALGILALLVLTVLVLVGIAG